MPFYEAPEPKYRDRQEAGEVLASQLASYRGGNTVVLAIPNGGVPVGIVIAKALEAPLYLMLVKKLQIPYNPEAGFGAVTSQGYFLLNEMLVKNLRISERDIQIEKQKAMQKVRSKEKLFGPWTALPELAKAAVILVDDGLASGFTMEVAVDSVRKSGSEKIIVAAPTSSMSAYRRLQAKAEVICPHIGRRRIFAVADAYLNWRDLEDEEVFSLLERFRAEERL